MPTPSPIAGGAPLALSIVAGAFIGLVMGEPTIGILAGTAVGVAIALTVWLRSRG